METTRDLGCADRQKSLERSLARRGKLPRSSLELNQLMPERDLARGEFLHESSVYWRSRRRAGEKRPAMPIAAGVGGISTLALLAATALPSLLGGRGSADERKAQLAYAPSRSIGPKSSSGASVAAADANARAISVRPRSVPGVGVQQRAATMIRAAVASAGSAAATTTAPGAATTTTAPTNSTTDASLVSSDSGALLAGSGGGALNDVVAVAARASARFTHRAAATVRAAVAPTRRRSAGAGAYKRATATIASQPAAILPTPLVPAKQPAALPHGTGLGAAHSGLAVGHSEPGPRRSSVAPHRLAKPSGTPVRAGGSGSPPPSGSGHTLVPPSGYVNPLAGTSVTPERIDQGVDYAGSGPLGAIGQGKVTYIGSSGTGWPGDFIEYRLVDGPDAGRYVYYAEGVSPVAGLHVGEVVRAGQQVAEIIPGYPTGIEVGWGAGGGTETYAASTQGWTPTMDADSVPTASGESFSSLIASLGGPPGKIVG